MKLMGVKKRKMDGWSDAIWKAVFEKIKKRYDRELFANSICKYSVHIFSNSNQKRLLFSVLTQDSKLNLLDLFAKNLD